MRIVLEAGVIDQPGERQTLRRVWASAEESHDRKYRRHAKPGSFCVVSTLSTVCRLIPNRSAASWTGSATAPAIADLLKQGARAGGGRSRAVSSSHATAVSSMSSTSARSTRAPSAKRKITEPKDRPNRIPGIRSGTPSCTASGTAPPSVSVPAARCRIRDGYAPETDIGSLNHSAGVGVAVHVTCSSPSSAERSRRSTCSAPLLASSVRYRSRQVTAAWV